MSDNAVLADQFNKAAPDLHGTEPTCDNVRDYLLYLRRRWFVMGWVINSKDKPSRLTVPQKWFDQLCHYPTADLRNNEQGQLCFRGIPFVTS